MNEVYIARRRVEFRDTDAAGIMHFSRYTTYMEEAEHELLRSCGLSVLTISGDEKISWPRVNVSCDFSGPLKFEQEFEVHVRIEKLGTKSVTYQFEFISNGKSLAKGKMTSVCCLFKPNRAPEPIEIPDSFRSQLTRFTI